MFSFVQGWLEREARMGRRMERHARRTAATAGLAIVVFAIAPARAEAMNVVHTAAVKKGPAAVAFDPVTHQALVGSVTEDTVSVFAGLVRVAELTAPGLNPAGLAVDGTGARLVVASHASNKVNVFSTADRRKVGSVDVPGPWGVDVDPETGNAFVAAFGDNTLRVIGRDNTARTVTLPGCAGAVGAAFARTDRRVLVTCTYSGTVHVVDGVTLQRISTITIGLGAYPWGVGVGATSSRAFVANWAGGSPTGGTISVIDVTGGREILRTFASGAPMGVTVSANGRPFVTLEASHKLAALDPATGAIVESVDLPRDATSPATPNNPQAAAVHPTGAYVVVGNYHGESVSFVFPGTNV